MGYFGVGPGALAPYGSGSLPSPAPSYGGQMTAPTSQAGNAYGLQYTELPGTNTKVSPFMDPTLASSYLGFLQGQVGTGLPQYNQSAYLPSTGTMSQPGSLTAPLNPILQQIEQFYQTGQGGPASGVLPMWNAETAAMNGPNGPIQTNLANLREQFGSMGALGSSEMATGVSDYLSQTSLDENSLLTQATLSALPIEQQFGNSLQTIDQSSIQNQYNQFQTDLPQNNPLLGQIGQTAMMTAQGLGTYNKTPSTLDQLLGALPGLMSSVGDVGSTLGMGGGIGSLMDIIGAF